MKKLILLSAIPGAGKSTWANNYVEKNKNENVFIVSSDEIRKEIGGSYKYFKEEAKVWDTFLNRANDYAKEYDDVTVIMDSTLLTNDYRKSYVLRTPNFDKHVLVYFDISFDLACKRNKERPEEKWVPLNAMERLFDQLEPVNNETLQLYDEYVECKMR